MKKAEIHSGESVYCSIHDTTQELKDGQEYYRHCLECGHTYLTEKELLDEVVQLNKKMGFTDEQVERLLHNKTGDQIYTCPLCAHDF